MFAIDGGTATQKLVKRPSDGSPPSELTFFSDQCRGFSVALGDIHFVATLLQLPAEEWDATRATFVPR